MSLWFWIRWFGLDTVLAVSSVHLLVMQSQWSFSTAVGLGFVTSFFYMCDRLVDMTWGHEVASNRHLIYRARPLLLTASLLMLGSGAVVFWVVLPSDVQWSLVMAFLIFLCHVGCLFLPWYQQGKDVVVSLIFTWVMVVFQWPEVDPRLVGLIFCYTLFNLRIHAMIDRYKSSDKVGRLLNTGGEWVELGVMGGVLWFGVQCYGGLGLAFGVGVGCHFVLLRWPGYYWFEWGELYYATPFFIVASKKMLA